jgi:hypothetical protein
MAEVGSAMAAVVRRGIEKMRVRGYRQNDPDWRPGFNGRICRQLFTYCTLFSIALYNHDLTSAAALRAQVQDHIHAVITFYPLEAQ